VKVLYALCLTALLLVSLGFLAGCGGGDRPSITAPTSSDEELDAKAITQAKNAKVAEKLKNGESTQYDAIASRSIVTVSKDEKGKVSYKARRKKPGEP